MPFTCAVPGCNGNYRTGPKVKVFGFPRDPQLREKWVKAIRRPRFEPTIYSKVCELHFTEDQIRRETACIDPQTGKTVTAPLIKLRLKEDAVPTLHINEPPVGKMSAAKRNIRSRDSVKSEKTTKISMLPKEPIPTQVIPSQQNNNKVKVKKKCKNDGLLMSPSAFLAEIETLEKRTHAAEQELQKIVAMCSSKNIAR